MARPPSVEQVQMSRCLFRGRPGAKRVIPLGLGTGEEVADALPRRSSIVASDSRSVEGPGAYGPGANEVFHETGIDLRWGSGMLAKRRRTTWSFLPARACIRHGDGRHRLDEHQPSLAAAGRGRTRVRWAKYRRGLRVPIIVTEDANDVRAVHFLQVHFVRPASRGRGRSSNRKTSKNRPRKGSPRI